MIAALEKFMPKKVKLNEEENEISRDFIEIEMDPKKSNHQKVQFGTTEVFFPYKPYGVQEEYMKHVIQALDGQKNALLQSPTGTGKTLSLLCATLAWLKQNRYEKYSQNIKAMSKPIRIIYASRTHSQLKQVAKELKASAYKPKVSMLGSRDQYCIKPEFQKLKSSMLNQECKKAVKANGCYFYNKDRLNYQSSLFIQEVMDIEEIKKFGQQAKVCPFYFERLRKEHADIILLPYNYLLEREFSDLVELDNCIVIFDEAHNVQTTSEEGSSFFISQKAIIDAEKELEKWIDQCESVNAISDQMTARLARSCISFKLRDYRRISITIRQFAHFLEEFRKTMLVPLNEDQKSIVLDGQEIFKILFNNTKDADNVFRQIDAADPNNYAAGINHSNIANYFIQSQILIEVMNDMGSHAGYHFEAWTKFIKNVKDFYTEQNDQNKISPFKLSMQLDKEDQLSIHMWCLDPGLGFQRIVAKSVYSIILTSGTLTPFESWDQELGIPFAITLNNKHIIDLQKDVRAFVSRSFNFSFQQRNNEEQINQLGMLLVNLSKVIPNGLLVVFASYALMNKMKNKWYYSKIQERLAQIKKLFWEPQESSDMPVIFQDYQHQARKTGAIMFCVQRGKVSEGIDFSDELCRAVFLVGVPYPPQQDKKVGEKKKYIDELQRAPGSYNRLTSNKWYTQQAIRSTNQALGRVIRHINDYGIVFLLDLRFDQGEIKAGISDWIRDAVRPFNQIQEIHSETARFFLREPNQQQPEQPLSVPVQIREIKRKPGLQYGMLNRQQIHEAHQLMVETAARINELDREKYEEQQQEKYINEQMKQKELIPPTQINQQDQSILTNTSANQQNMNQAPSKKKLVIILKKK